jgi:hypothetical protein
MLVSKRVTGDGIGFAETGCVAVRLISVTSIGAVAVTAAVLALAATDCVAVVAVVAIFDSDSSAVLVCAVA